MSHVIGPFKRLIRIFLAMVAFFFIADIVYVGLLRWFLDHIGRTSSPLVVALPLFIILKILEFVYLLTFLPFILIPNLSLILIPNGYYKQLTWAPTFLSGIIVAILTIFIYAVILNIVINTMKYLHWLTKKQVK